MEIPDLDEESRSLGGIHGRLYEQVGALARKHHLGRGELPSAKLLGPRAPGDVSAIHDVTRQVHSIEPAQRERHPGLLWIAGLLAGHAGDWQDALDMLGDVTRCPGPAAEARLVWEAILLLSLETRQFEQARKAHDRLRQLIPWSVHACPAGYEVLECLRADLTGVVWRVREHSTGLVRALQLIDRDHVDQSDLMLQIHASPMLAKDHPAAERVVFHGKAENSSRMIRVSEDWPGSDLMTEIATKGPIPVSEVGELAWHLVQGVLSCHRRGLIHRGIIPERVLVWKQEGEGGGWRCRLIGADLVPKRAVIHAWVAMEDGLQSSASLDSALEFARWLAPESKGRPKGIVWQGPIQDVYGIGRTLLFALTGSDKAKGPAWEELPENWRNFLTESGAWLQARRIGTVEELALKLAELIGDESRARFEAEAEAWKLSELEAMAAAEPGNAEAFRGLGRFLQAKESWQEAGEAFSKAISIDDNDAPARVARAMCHSRRRRPDLAEEDLRRAREIAPDRVQTLVSLVGVLRVRHRELEALALLDEAIGKQGSEFALHMERGLTLKALDRDEGAEESFARAAQLQPANPYPQIFRARALFHAGRNWEAAKVLTGVMPLLFLLDQDERAATFLELSRVRRALNNHAEALAAADEAAESVSGSAKGQIAARVALARALALLGLGRTEEAVAAFTELCPMPEDWPSVGQAADSCSKTEAPTEELLAALNAMVNAQPDMVSMRRFRAMAHLALIRDGRGKGLEASVIDDIHAGKGGEPLPPHVRQALVEMLTLAGRHEEALAEVGQCLAVGKDGTWKAERRRILARAGRIGEALKGCNDSQFRSELQKLAGRHADALDTLAKAAAKKSAEAGKWLILGDAQAAHGQWERARNSIRMAMSLEPKGDDARMRLAMIHLAMDRGDLVFNECSPPAMEEAKDAWLPILVDAMIQGGRWHEAAGLLEKLQKDGFDTNWIASKWLAMMRARGNRDGVMASVHELTNFLPGDPAMLELLADQDAADGDPAHAITLVDRVLKIRPNHLPSASRKALLLARVSRWQEAIALQRQVVAAMPLNPLPLNNLAWMLAKAPEDCGGGADEAVRLAEEACRLTLEENPNAMDTLAEALAARGETDRATALLKRAIALKSNHPWPNRGQGATLEILTRRLAELESSASTVEESQS